MPDKNTRWIIGTTITVAIALSAQMALMISMIAGLREDIEKGFNQIEQRFDQIEQRFDQIEQRFNERFNRMEQRLDGFDERRRAFEISFARIDQRLSPLERNLFPSAPGAPN